MTSIPFWIRQFPCFGEMAQRRPLPVHVCSGRSPAARGGKRSWPWAHLLWPSLGPAMSDSLALRGPWAEMPSVWELSCRQCVLWGAECVLVGPPDTGEGAAGGTPGYANPSPGGETGQSGWAPGTRGTGRAVASGLCECVVASHCGGGRTRLAEHLPAPPGEVVRGQDCVGPHVRPQNHRTFSWSGWGFSHRTLLGQEGRFLPGYWGTSSFPLQAGWGHTTEGPVALGGLWSSSGVVCGLHGAQPVGLPAGLWGWSKRPTSCMSRY